MAYSVGKLSAHIPSRSEGCMPFDLHKSNGRKEFVPSLVQEGYIPTRRDDLNKFAKVKRIYNNIKNGVQELGTKIGTACSKAKKNLSPSSRARAERREKLRQENLQNTSAALGDTESGKNLKRFQIIPQQDKKLNNIINKMDAKGPELDLVAIGNVDHKESISLVDYNDEKEPMECSEYGDANNREESISLEDSNFTDDNSVSMNDEFSLSDNWNECIDYEEDDSNNSLLRQDALHLSKNEVGQLISSADIDAVKPEAPAPSSGQTQETNDSLDKNTQNKLRHEDVPHLTAEQFHGLSSSLDLGVHGTQSADTKGKFWESRIIHDTLVSAREKLSEIKNKIGNKTSAAYANVKDWVLEHTSHERYVARRKEQANKAFEELNTVHGLDLGLVKKLFPYLNYNRHKVAGLSSGDIDAMRSIISNETRIITEYKETLKDIKDNTQKYLDFVKGIKPVQNRVMARYNYLKENYSENFAKNTFMLSDHNNEFKKLDKYIVETAIPNWIVCLSFLPKQPAKPDA
jgi:hypothetical protein